MKLKTGMVALAAVASLAVSACSNSNAANAAGASGGGGASTASKGPLKIGVIVPLSGPSGPNGQDVLNAIQVEADALNKAGGVDGRQIQVVSGDDMSTPADGVAAANKMVTQNINVVMGGWNSPVTLAEQPILVRAGILNITTIPQDSSIIGGADPDAIRMNAGNQVGGYVAAQFLAKLEATKIGTLAENDAYGDDAVNFMKKYLPSGSSVVTEQKFDFTDTDFRVPDSNVKAARPNAVFSADASEASGQPALMKQLSQDNLGIPYFAGLGTVSQSVINLAGAAANGMYSADLYFPNLMPWASIPQNKAFVSAFQAKTGNLPDKYAALGAESVEVWAKAVESAGTTDRGKVAAAIKNHTFTNTVLGSVTFTDQGQMVSNIYVFKVANQKPQIISQVNVPFSIWHQ